MTQQLHLAISTNRILFQTPKKNNFTNIVHVKIFMLDIIEQDINE